MNRRNFLRRIGLTALAAAFIDKLPAVEVNQIHDSTLITGVEKTKRWVSPPVPQMAVNAHESVREAYRRAAARAMNNMIDEEMINALSSSES